MKAKRTLTRTCFVPVFFLAFWCLAAAAVQEPETLLREASEHIAQSDTAQVNASMVMDFSDGQRDISATLTISIVFGQDSRAFMHLKTDHEELMIYSSEETRYLYFPDKNTYRELPAEPDRAQLLRSVVTGPLESAFGWISAFMHSTQFSFEEPPTFADAATGDDAAQYVLDMAFAQFDVRAFISEETPPLLRRFTLDFNDAALRNYTASPEGSLRVTADFTDWTFNATLPDDTFQFTPPSDATQETAPGRPQHSLEGKAAPEFTLPLLDGGSMTLEQHHGEDIVILDFWASWCGPCRRGLPIVVSVANRFKDDNVVLYAVNLRETPEQARAFLKQNDLDMTVAMDRNGTVAAQYGVSAIPRLILIGRDGLVKSVHAGMSPQLERQLADELGALIREAE